MPRTDPVPQVALLGELDPSMLANCIAYEAAISANHTIRNATVCQKVMLRLDHPCIWYSGFTAGFWEPSVTLTLT